MHNNNTPNNNIFESGDGKKSLEEILRQGAEKLLAAACRVEIDEYLTRFQELVDEDGHQVIVGNGYLPERELTTGIGAIKVKQPRVRDKRGAENSDIEPFVSKLLPKYLRRIPSIDNLLPVLYLKGISTGDMKDSLLPILGPDAKNVSPNVVCKLKRKWEDEFEIWRSCRLEHLHIVYIWADGIHFQPKMEDEKACTLVVIGADKYGKKHLLALNDGYRESKESWSNILLDMQSRGMNTSPKLAVGDGAMGFWAAMREIFPDTSEQRCWFHKQGNVLDKMPKRIQPKANTMLKQIYLADTRKDANKEFDNFLREYSVKYPKATECLEKDRKQLMSFFDFPAEQWPHIRTTNPIESTFATVRHRTYKTRNTSSRKTLLPMAFKLLIECEKKWRKLRGFRQILYLVAGRKFENGILKAA
jgi:putative transposase